MACGECGTEPAVYLGWILDIETLHNRPIELCKECFDQYRVCSLCGSSHRNTHANLSIRQAQNWSSRMRIIDPLGARLRLSFLDRVAPAANVCSQCALQGVEDMLSSFTQLCDGCGTAARYRFRLVGGRIEVRWAIAQTIDPDTGLCERCRTTRVQCEVCGNYVDEECIIPGEGCYDCVDEMIPVHEYDYVPSQFHIHQGEGETKALTFGIEYEFPTGDNRDIFAHTFQSEMAKLLGVARKDLHRYLYCVHDGSLNSGGMSGFECVLHPMSLNFIIQSNILGMIEQAITTTHPSIEKNCNNHPQCGLHIHLSKKGLSLGQMYKMSTFCHSNVKNLVHLARRQPNNYCSDDIRDRSIVSAIVRGCRDRHSRYSFVNVLPANTIEFRFFKGTSRQENVMLALELVESLRFWALDTPLNQVKFSEFVRYVFKHRKDFPNLYRRIQELTKTGVKFEDQALHPRAFRKVAWRNDGGDRFVLNTLLTDPLELERILLRLQRETGSSYTVSTTAPNQTVFTPVRSGTTFSTLTGTQTGRSTFTVPLQAQEMRQSLWRSIAADWNDTNLAAAPTDTDEFTDTID